MTQELKNCLKCGESLPLDRFSVGKNQCKFCRTEASKKCNEARREEIKEYHRKYHEKNKQAAIEAAKRYRKENSEKIKQQQKQHYSENKESIAAYKKQYAEKNKDKISAAGRKRYAEKKTEIIKKTKEYYNVNKKTVSLKKKEYAQKNKEKIFLSGKKYREANKEKISALMNDYMKKRLKEDINFHLKHKISGRIRLAVKKRFTTKAAKTTDLLGCDYDTFKKYFEGLFTEGMTWDLLLCGKIHIDHIVPCARFDLSDPAQQRYCFHYKNLQPLWALDNIKKRDKLLTPAQMVLGI